MSERGAELIFCLVVELLLLDLGLRGEMVVVVLRCVFVVLLSCLFVGGGLHRIVVNSENCNGKSSQMMNIGSTWGCHGGIATSTSPCSMAS